MLNNQVREIKSSPSPTQAIDKKKLRPRAGTPQAGNQKSNQENQE
jgi:hypothetical protein